MTKSVSTSKTLLRAAYRGAMGAHTIINAPFVGRGVMPRVFYGGARMGDVGGPLVKVKRLQQYFPEHRWGYNLVYGLSNAPYLPRLALELLKSRRVPIVLNQNGVYYPAWFAGGWQAYNTRMSHAYHLASHVFWQSDFCRMAADKFLGVRSGPGEILYNAVDTDHFAPSVRANDDRHAPFRFLLTGVIDTHLYYRIKSTIEALSSARNVGLDCELEIAGTVSPEAAAKAKTLIEQLQLTGHVRISGPYSQEGAPSVYRRAHAYIMLKHNDPCPNAVIEALSCGLPVVYSDTGGAGELVDLCGVGIACGDSWDVTIVPETKDVSDGMLYVAENHAELSAKARTRAVERFGMPHWVARHEEVFNQLIAERS